MTSFSRTDTSLLSRWWWTVDRSTLSALAVLMGVGMVLTLAASTAVADRLGRESFELAHRQLLLVPIAALVLFGVSFASVRWVRRLALAGLTVGLVLLAATLFTTSEIKGATRWLSVGGHSLQPSEFVKPFFAVTAAWLFAAQRLSRDIPGNLISVALLFVILTLLAMQPDMGQAFLVATVWLFQFFLAGLPLAWLIGCGLLGVAALGVAYLTSSHVTQRVDAFFSPDMGERYQIERSLEAFRSGGLFGRGPGEGTVKTVLPDAHADFIFAVAGEELGVIVCLLIIGIFAFVVLRGMSRLLREDSLFVLLAAAGLLAHFALQALINMASALDLIPTKGLTLPFISYGGSSLLALSVGMGMLLALTRRRIPTGNLA
jgi:cell division protein FtsW